MPSSADIGLQRFEQHHPDEFDQALSEIRAGRKQTHWMWFIFPQLASLGRSDTAREYGVTTFAEAEAYLRHPVLGRDYSLIVSAVLDQLERGAGLTDLMGPPDDLKLVSSVTLFGGVARKLDGPTFVDLANLCDEVLGQAEAQGFKPCATTRSFVTAAVSNPDAPERDERVSYEQHVRLCVEADLGIPVEDSSVPPSAERDKLRAEAGRWIENARANGIEYSLPFD